MLRLVAHRGRVGNDPENTIESLQRLPPWVDAVEVDARLTADGECVLMHDGTLDRTTSGSGRLKDFAWRDIRRHTVTGGAKIPRLTSFLVEAQRTWLDVYIDVKSASRVAADAVAAVVQASSIRSRCVLLLRDPRQLVRVRANHPRLRLGILGADTGNARTVAKSAHDVRAEIAFVAPGDETYMQDRAAVGALLASGLEVGASWINKPDVIATATRDGCTTILTDQCLHLHAWKAQVVEQLEADPSSRPSTRPLLPPSTTAAHAVHDTALGRL